MTSSWVMWLTDLFTDLGHVTETRMFHTLSSPIRGLIQSASIAVMPLLTKVLSSVPVSAIFSDFNYYLGDDPYYHTI